MAPKKRQDNFFEVCGTCRTCCCQEARPPITSKRRKIIEAYLKKQGHPTENLFVQTGYTHPREDAEGYCVFYDHKTGKCKIHPVKPETCMAGPVTFDINGRTRKIEWHLKTAKICPLADKMYRKGPAMKKHLGSAKKEICQLLQELDSEALQTILKREEPDTIKIDEDAIGKDVLDKLINK